MEGVKSEKMRRERRWEEDERLREREWVEWFHN